MIADYGIASYFTSSDFTSAKTTSIIRWSAPETIALPPNPNPQPEQIDIFALGMTMLEVDCSSFLPFLRHSLYSWWCQNRSSLGNPPIPISPILAPYLLLHNTKARNFQKISLQIPNSKSCSTIVLRETPKIDPMLSRLPTSYKLWVVILGIVFLFV